MIRRIKELRTSSPWGTGTIKKKKKKKNFIFQILTETIKSDTLGDFISKAMLSSRTHNTVSEDVNQTCFQSKLHLRQQMG